VHGTTAITAITAQNTVGVSQIHAVPAQIILAQVRAVSSDIGVDAVKVGMLNSAETVDAVSRALDELPKETPVVVDPVMVAESGARLLQRDAQRALIDQVVPRATVPTPNLAEARVLAGAASDGHGGDSAEDEQAEAEQLVRTLLALGPRCVVLTGGHRAQAVDLFLAGDGEIVAITGERHPDGAAHGSGCTHSSVLAAQLALGRSPLQAARVARELTGEAIARGLRAIGSGAGPVDVLGLAEMGSSAAARVRRLS
jgi:hydroxymethylpyrimidine/phosphomethylpyrimidine kinase